MVKSHRKDHKEMLAVYGVDSLKEYMCQNWLKQFHSGDFSLKGDQRRSRLSEVDDDSIKAIHESNRHIMCKKIAENHIRCLGSSRSSIFGFHMKEIHLTQRVDICDTHFKHNAINPFFKRIVIRDQKWINNG
ncbi:histone-lysine N-methyltransferase SETMAR-like [Stegodyphus dumicola]|uniref:histone-lysine N-methyltransferase SETMAR-like n=1 Tax=Stegodyphus dumicola TaxID=202533 RepID=UPI0015ADA862|nr:histone-lysine N-methyltransferase SETMAR-like [Stegodyphus dumicola]